MPFDSDAPRQKPLPSSAITGEARVAAAARQGYDAARRMDPAIDGDQITPAGHQPSLGISGDLTYAYGRRPNPATVNGRK